MVDAALDRGYAVIAPDGTVLGDSERDGPDLEAMDDELATALEAIGYVHREDDDE